MRATGVDPRDQRWESDSPAYRVNFWESGRGGGWASEMWELEEADVGEVLTWAAEQAAGRTVSIWAVHRDADGLGLIRLAGSDPVAVPDTPPDRSPLPELATVDPRIDLLADLRVEDADGYGLSELAGARNPFLVRPGVTIVAGNARSLAKVRISAVDDDGFVHFVIEPGTLEKCGSRDEQAAAIAASAAYVMRSLSERRHLLAALIMACEQAERVRALIGGSPSAGAAQDALMRELDLDADQARVVLDAQNRRLAQAERQQLAAERDRLLAQYAEYEAIVASRERQGALIGTEEGRALLRLGAHLWM